MDRQGAEFWDSWSSYGLAHNNSGGGYRNHQQNHQQHNHQHHNMNRTHQSQSHNQQHNNSQHYNYDQNNHHNSHHFHPSNRGGGLGGPRNNNRYVQQPPRGGPSNNIGGAPRPFANYQAHGGYISNGPTTSGSNTSSIQSMSIVRPGGPGPGGGGGPISASVRNSMNGQWGGHGREPPSLTLELERAFNEGKIFHEEGSDKDDDDENNNVDQSPCTTIRSQAEAVRKEIARSRSKKDRMLCYESFQNLHREWIKYFRKVDEPGSSIIIVGAKVRVYKQNNQYVNDESSCQQGDPGLVLRETRHMIDILKEDNKLKMYPKRSIELEVDVFGNRVRINRA